MIYDVRCKIEELKDIFIIINSKPWLIAGVYCIIHVF